MSRLALSRSARWSMALAAVLLALLAVEGWRLHQQRATNARILIPTPQALRADDALEVVHAEALRQGHAGNTRAAHELYARVAMHGRADLRLRAEYNHANLLLREALQLRANNETDDGRALPILELAKESYRRVLREAPQSWDARYNLERALRLAPEPPEVAEGDGPAPLQRERAPTTMRGQTLGLP